MLWWSIMTKQHTAAPILSANGVKHGVKVHLKTNLALMRPNLEWWDWNVGSDLRARCAVCSPRTPLVQNLFFGFLSSVVANWESCSSISIGQGDKDWLAWTKKTQRTYLVCPHARPSIELLTSYKPTCCNWKQVFLLHTRFFLCVYLPELDLLVE